MNKEELIAIHRLLSLVLEEAKENTEGLDVTEEFNIQEYRDLGVNPNAVHKTNTQQKEAILSLASKLGKGIEKYGDDVRVIETEQESVSVDEMEQTRNRAQEQLANASKQFGSSSSQEEQDTTEDDTSNNTGSDHGDDSVDWGQMS